MSAVKSRVGIRIQDVWPRDPSRQDRLPPAPSCSRPLTAPAQKVPPQPAEAMPESSPRREMPIVQALSGACTSKPVRSGSVRGCTGAGTRSSCDLRGIRAMPGARGQDDRSRPWLCWSQQDMRMSASSSGVVMAGVRNQAVRFSGVDTLKQVPSGQELSGSSRMGITAGCQAHLWIGECWRKQATKSRGRRGLRG